MRKLVTLLIALLLMSGSSWAQTTVFTENFDGAWTTPPTLSPAWSGTATTSLEWHKNDYTAGWPYGNGGSYSPTGALSTSNSARFNTYGIDEGFTSDFISPTIDLSSYTAGTNNLEFYFINPSGTDVLDVYLSTDDGATWGSSLITCTVSAGWTQHTAIALNTTSTTVKIKFTGTSDFGSDDIGLDQVKIYNYNPVNPILSAAPASLSFGFVAFGSGSTEHNYSLSGINLTAGPVTVTAPAGFQVSLTTGGPYTSTVDVTYTPPTLAATNIYVKFIPLAAGASYGGIITNVGGGASADVSVTGSSDLFASYCTSGAANSGDEDITLVQFGTTLNNTSACGSLTGSQGTATGTAHQYSNFTSIAPTSVQRSVNTPISVAVTECYGYAYGHEVKVYIDFNQNASLTDPGEEFTIWPYTYSNTHTILANILIPADAILGTTLMRVVCKESTVTGPCVISSWGETEDYKINILEAPACAAPTTLTATDITEDIAFLGWTESGTATSWDIEWGLAGFTPGTGTLVLGVTGNPYKLQGLTASTNYAFYVRANCPGGGNSIFTGPHPFTTLGIPPCANAVSPLNGAINVATAASLNWSSGGGAPTGYKLYFGKTSPPPFIGDLGLVTTYTPAIAMDYTTVYYWQVVPYTASGDAVGCSEWSFTTAAPSYCAAGSGTCDEYISNVTVGAINNSTDCSTGGYANYTALSTMMSEGGSYPISVTNGTVYSSDQCGIWVDWNHDFDFDDPGEAVTVGGTPALFTATIVPPVGAVTGDTRMRVRITYTGTVSPCGTTSFGEVEDYTITVSPPLDHDAGTITIDNIPASALPGTVIAPKATVKNFGLNTESFDVTLTTTGYSSTVAVTGLAAGATTQVTFSNWIPAVGNFTLEACTQLVGDMYAANNCKTSSALVSTAIWTAGSAVPTGSYLGAGVGYTDNSVVPPVGYLFCFGGNTSSGLGTECQKFNLNTNTWSAIAPLPSKRIVVASAIVGDNIYVIGGSDGTSANFNTVFRYNIPTDTWTTMPSTLPKTIAWGKAVGYVSNYIYLAGGIDAFTAGVVVSDVYLYNIALDSWSVATSMPSPKFGGAFSRTGTKLVYVAGADLSVISNEVYVGTIDPSNPNSIAWVTAKSSYPGTVGQPVMSDEDPAATTVSTAKIPVNTNRVNYPGGVMYRFDGAPWGTDGIIVAAGSPTAAWTPGVPSPCYYYNPTTDTWQAKPDVPTPVLGAYTGSVDLNNAGTHTWSLILASGYTGSIISSATQILTEQFTPAIPLAVSGTVTEVTGCFGNTNGAISTLVTGGTPPYTYLWSNLATTSSLSGIGAGTYSVTVTDAASGHISGNWSIAQPAQIDVFGIVTNATCPTSNNGSINVTISGGTPGYVYVWSNGASTEDLSGIAPGNYTVTVTDDNNCIKTGTWMVGQENAVCSVVTVTGTVTGTVCYNALTTITAGPINIQAPLGNATFIAGHNILFEPGTFAHSGSYMHGYISTTFCTSPTSPVTVAGTGQEELQTNITSANFTLYPNPTNGNFTLVQKGERSFGTVKVEVFSMNGEKVMTEQMIGEKKHEFRFSDIQVGLYFVKVIADDYVETIKLIKTR